MLFPDLDRYQGPPLEYGRMEPTASDPSVQQQFGMIVGKPNAGQVSALGTLNIRGERSVTCKGDFDRHPFLGPSIVNRMAAPNGVEYDANGDDDPHRHQHADFKWRAIQ